MLGIHFLPLLVGGALIFQKRLSSEFQLIVLLMLFSTLIDLVSYFSSNLGINNMVLFHLYNCIDVTLILMFIRKIVVQNAAKVFILYVIVLYILFSFIQMPIVGFENLNSLQSGVGSILIITAIFYSFLEIFLYEHIEDLAKYPPFWINSVLLIFYAGTFLLYMSDSFFINGTNSIVFSKINTILLIVLNCVISLCLWMARTV